ncbi:MAG: hypothetical protein GY772_31365 [bacterium]|nr:hypothetical protein [bacterium]
MIPTVVEDHPSTGSCGLAEAGPEEHASAGSRGPATASPGELATAGSGEPARARRAGLAKAGSAWRAKADIMSAGVAELLLGVGSGETSVTKMGRLADALARDTGCAALAELGRFFGHNAERDLHRWVASQSWSSLLPPLCRFVMPRRGRGAAEGTDTSGTHCALLPHEVFGRLHAEAKDLFHTVMTGGPSHLEAWWSAAATGRGRWHMAHPVIKAAPPLLRVPLGIHGDDAGAHGDEKILVVTWGSVATALPTLDTRVLFAMAKDSEMAKPASLQTLWRVLAWSFCCLADGVYPAADHDGRPFGPGHHPGRAALAGKPLTVEGHRGCWAELRGDWKFLRETLFLRNFYGTPNICHLCSARRSRLREVAARPRPPAPNLPPREPAARPRPAVPNLPPREAAARPRPPAPNLPPQEAAARPRPAVPNLPLGWSRPAASARPRPAEPLPPVPAGRWSRPPPADRSWLYTDFSPDAAHRHTLVTHGAWLEEARAGELVAPLLDIPGFDIWAVKFDIMHCLDLGVYQVVVSSAITELARPIVGVFRGVTPHSRMEHATRLYRAAIIHIYIYRERRNIHIAL